MDGVVPGSNASIRVTADRGLVRWQEFSVQAGERFRIEGTPNQAILNVVTGSAVSSIGGAVESGPRFLLANPNGIEVLGTGQIIAPSTWLTTGSVRDDDWLQHRSVSPGADVAAPHIRLDRQTAINLAGVLDAEDGVHGGEVTVLAHDIHLSPTALVTASGANGGGRIRIGGQRYGLGPEPPATQVTVAEGARLQANATKVGDGGEIVIWAEESTRFAGQIQARGGPEGGEGGWVEVSGRQQLDFQGLVNTMAPQGRVGTLLLDPTDLTINNAVDTNINISPGVSLLPSSSPSVLTWNTIQKNLTNSSLLIQTTGSPASGSQKGAITITEASPDLDLSNRSLTFQAADDIKINASVHSTATTGALAFKAGTTGSGNSVSIANGKQLVANQVTLTADSILFNGGS
ncbi:MAG: filamentous hemagglutinin N-terminal domain-containing protein, partial [Cyanobacteriota bacterium]